MQTSFGATNCAVLFAICAYSQEFQNLDFQEAKPPFIPIPGDSYSRIPVDSALPGWGLYTGDTREYAILYKTTDLLPGTAVWLLAEGSVAAGVSGYSVYLRAGISVNDGRGASTSIRQSGTFSADTKSLTFAGVCSKCTVSLNDEPLTLEPIAGGRYIAEVSQFAGQKVRLAFAANYFPNGGANQGSILVDSVQFSSIAIVPEPECILLVLAGLTILAGRRTARVPG